MARNRKYQSAAVRFGPALKAFLLCLLIGGSGVGYVWQKSKIYELGQQMKMREIRLGQLVNQNRKLEKHLHEMRTPDFLGKRIQELGLIAPPRSQVWQLEEPSRDSSKAGQPPYALQDNRTAAKQ